MNAPQVSSPSGASLFFSNYAFSKWKSSNLEINTNCLSEEVGLIVKHLRKPAVEKQETERCEGAYGAFLLND